MSTWADDAIFYHVYPLGYCAAPERNDFVSAPIDRLSMVTERVGAMAELGATALYLGPVFESVAHGYDTVDYKMVDRRLGDSASLARLSQALHARGMRLVLDAVFNHVGREHPWFRSLRESGEASPEKRRFRGLRFGAQPGGGPGGDGFFYEGWNGHHDLAKLELRDPSTRETLIASALYWIEEWDIDGLRLDAADCLELDFIRELAAACRARKPGFWLLGEIVHGDYRLWTAPGLLDSVTNYEAWKGLWSSHNDANYFEIAWSLKRQFGSEGIYRGLGLYSFANNHDVDRVASLLADKAHLYPLHCLLFTMPGAPSIYYGSERGIEGRKVGGSDAPMRPPVQAVEAAGRSAQPELATTIGHLAALRKRLPALRRGDYRELAVAAKQLAFERSCPEGRVVVALNASHEQGRLRLSLPEGEYRDELNGGTWKAVDGILEVELPPCWARVLAPVTDLGS